MAFRFSLQTILRLRESYERLERMRLLALTAAMGQLKLEIHALDEESAEAQKRMREKLSGGLSGAEMQFETACEKLRAEHRTALEEKLRAAEKMHAKQQTAYRLARQKRRILENLRERRLDEYKREQARREQQQLDEIHSIHRLLKPTE